MSLQCNVSGACALLFPVDIKFVHSSRTDSEHFETRSNRLLCLSNILTVDHVQPTVSDELYDKSPLSFCMSNFTNGCFGCSVISSASAHTVQ